MPPPLPSAIDAGYQTPTLIALTPGGSNQPGLFTKPAISAYPQYLKDACAEELSQVPQKSCTTIHYKSATRAYIESLGYDIVGNFGDQFSDLEGGYADKTFKLPNPNYYLPNTGVALHPLLSRGRPAAGEAEDHLDVEDDRHRPVVDELDLHPRAEDARLHPDAEVAQALDEAVDERRGDLGRRGVGEARTLPLARIGEERELAHDERLAARVEQRPVEAPVFVREDPEPRDLRRETLRCRVVVLRGRAEEHEQPRAARPDDVAVDAHLGPRDPLDDRSHRAILYARDVAVVELRDREEIAAFLRRRPAVHAYALGDLDDFFWPHTRWLGLAHDGKLAQVALVYDEPDPPVLLALAEEPQETMAELLVAAAERLPPTLYAHVSPSLLARIEPALAATTEPVAHKKLGLVRPGALAAYDTEAVDRLGPGDLDEVERFYAKAYPGTWFQARMLETGRYVGIRRGGALACVAGVHVWSPAWGVAALGNVATVPEARRTGLATVACARLCRILLDDGIDTISLNVRADNDAAIRAYEKLGFAHAADYIEVVLSSRKMRDTLSP